MFKNLYIEMASKNRMSQKQLATILGISEKSISNKLTGKCEFSLKEMQKIQKIFNNKSLDYLFEQKQQEPKQPA